MTALLAGIEQSAFSVWVRESGSVWSYPSIIFLHTVGLALLVGLNVAIDLRLLGVARDVPLAPLARFFRIMWAGFWMNVVSGTVLLASDANTTLRHPAFYVKIAFIAAAVTILTTATTQARPSCYSGAGRRTGPLGATSRSTTSRSSTKSLCLRNWTR